MKCNYLLFLFVFVGLTVQGQNSNPLDGQYQPPATSVFGNPVPSSSPYLSKKTKESREDFVSERKKNVLSFSVSDLVRSNIRIVFERQLTPTFCITIGGGTSFGNDPFEQVFGSYIVARNFAFSQTVPYITDLYSDSKRTSGYHVSASVRSYFSQEEKSALFCEMNWRMMNNSYEILQSHKIDYNPNSLTYNTTIHHFALMLGCAFNFNSGKMVAVHELSFGFGVKQSIWDKYVIRNMPQVNSGYGTQTWYEKLPTMTSAVKTPVFLVRYQLGMGW
jgi:hypothetical protein